MLAHPASPHEAIELRDGVANEVVIAETLNAAIAEAKRRLARWAAGCKVIDLDKLTLPQEIQTIVCAVPRGDMVMTSACQAKFQKPTMVSYAEPIV